MALNTKHQMVNFDEVEEARGNSSAQQSVTPTQDTATAQETPVEKEVSAAQGSVAVAADSRVQGVNTDKQTALDEVSQTYDGMIDSVDQKYQELSDNVEQAAGEQAQLQREQTDLAIQQIEQQKADAEKDYLKEQSAAYADWQKQSAQHGVNAEQMAAMGMAGTGYSESSQVAMYNAYQARVAVARESVNAAIVSYNNAIAEAKLQNSSALAEIALTALQQQMELALEGFQYKNQLILEKANQKAAVDNTYYNRYLDVLEQINAEKALAEEQRQFDESLKASDEGAEGLFIGTDDSGSESGTTIAGHGSASKTGLTVEVDGKDLDIWQAEDGTLWYFDGKEYVQVEHEGSDTFSGKGGKF